MKRALKLVALFAFVFILAGCGKKVVDLDKTKIVLFHDLQVELPDVFEKSKESSDLIEFYGIDDYDYDLAICSIDISYSTLYSFSGNLEEEIKEDISLDYYQPYETNRTTINGTEWAYTTAKSHERDDGYYSTTMYTSDHNDKRYTLKITNYVAEKYSCNKLIQKVMNSARFQ